MLSTNLVRFYNRYTDQIETEAIYGESYLRFIYGNPLGKLALWAAVKRAFFRSGTGTRCHPQLQPEKSVLLFLTTN